jgi:hypothetical protein
MPQRPLEYIYPGIVAAQAIHAAVQFRIPDLLATGPKTAVELASECGAHAPTLDRLLRALTSLDMFRQTPDRRYANTPLTEILRTDQTQSLSAVARFLPAPYLWAAMGGLPESVRTGEPAFNRAFGQSFFDYLASHPQEAAAFNQVMTLEIAWISPAILRAYDFSRFKTLVDVGGGQGAFMRDILVATPALRGILFDQPQVVADAEKILSGEIAKRATIAAGSFFDHVPEGGDAYILKRIIHDWMDDDAAKILRNVRRAITPGGTLLLIDALVDSQTHPAGLADLMMLVLGGCERTEAQFRALLKSAGFSLTRIVPAGAYSLIEGQPV